jgi:hypothetical protein
MRRQRHRQNAAAGQREVEQQLVYEVRPTAAPLEPLAHFGA